MTLPYELIGRIVVQIVATILFLGVTAVLGFGALFVWVRGWRFISDMMWKGIDPKTETPPLWRTRIAAVCAALSTFQFRKIPAAYREATKIANNDEHNRVL